MLSNASKYAIRAILYLAQNSNIKNKIGAKSIAIELETPQPFLAKLLRQLSANMLVTSTKGPGGGFYLTDKNKEKYLWDVIVCIDGGYKFEQCFLGLSKCNNKNPCPVHHIVSPFKEKILNDFKGKTINDLAEEIKTDGTLISLKGLNI
jgi:Rrf2 family iron-sulfur cluster assembly transcriptional regulator